MLEKSLKNKINEMAGFDPVFSPIYNGFALSKTLFFYGLAVLSNLLLLLTLFLNIGLIFYLIKFRLIKANQKNKSKDEIIVGKC